MWLAGGLRVDFEMGVEGKGVDEVGALWLNVYGALSSFVVFGGPLRTDGSSVLARLRQLTRGVCLPT